MANIERARKALVERILQGEGKAEGVHRRAAFDNATLPEPLQTLVRKVASRAATVTDEDVSNALRSGVTEDQLFELVVCAAVGQATRQHEAALRALESVLPKGS